MKTYQKLLIKNIKKEISLPDGTIRQFHPQKEKYLKLISDIKEERKILIPKKFVEMAKKESKSDYTRENIIEYQGFKSKREKVKYRFTNKKNLRVIYAKENGDILIVEINLKSDDYTYAFLYNIAFQHMIDLNLKAKKQYDAELVSIIDFYVVDRYK